jgi:hypothetical protein
MVKRKYDANEMTTNTFARNCTRISDCVNAKYFADFVKDADLLNLSICNPIYYSDFYRLFANRIWWPLQHVQNVTDSTLNHIRKFNCSHYEWLESSKVKLPQSITSLLLWNPHHDNEKYFWLIEKYKHNLHFLEVIGDCKNLHIPDGVKVFVQKRGNVNTNFSLNLPNSLHEVSISCFDNQNITAFPPSLTKLTFDMYEFGIQKYSLPNFPTGLVHLTLMDGFNQFVSEFPPGLMSLTIQNNIWNQKLVSLPTGLQYFKLYGESTIPLNPGILPRSLKIFIYKSKCNIQENVLPLQLKYFSITIDSDYGLYFDCKFLPQSVVQLNITSFNSYVNGGLKYIEMMPESVKIFKFKTVCNVNLRKLPQQLEELCIQSSQCIFTQEYASVVDFRNNNCTLLKFSPHLRCLFVQCKNFYPQLHQSVFPENLQTLHFNCNVRIRRNILPTGMKSLSLGKNCKQLLVYGSLPKSLESFSAPYLSSKKIKLYQKTGVIPKSCLIK